MQHKLLVFSDSHGYHEHLVETVKKMQNDVTHVLHLGDGYNDYSKCLNIKDNLIFNFAPGNCDFGTGYASTSTMDINNKKVLMAHGYQFDVKSTYNRICYFAEESNADICLFGHTHIPVDFYHNGILIFNPGSITFSRDLEIPTYGIINIDDNGKIDYALFGIYKKTHKKVYG